jgi:hypothetical protein
MYPISHDQTGRITKKCQGRIRMPKLDTTLTSLFRSDPYLLCALSRSLRTHKRADSQSKSIRSSIHPSITMSSIKSVDKGAAPPATLKIHPLQHFLAGACAGIVEVSSFARSIHHLIVGWWK